MGYASGNGDVTGEPWLQRPPSLLDEVWRALRLNPTCVVASNIGYAASFRSMTAAVGNRNQPLPGEG
jgi:hypothetical protein